MRLKLFVVLAVLLKTLTVFAATENTSISTVAPKSTSEKSINLRYQVLGVFVNSHTLEADFAISPKITVGPIVNYQRLGGILPIENNLEISRNYYGLAAHYFVTGSASSDGLYLKPYILQSSINAKVKNSLASNLEKTEAGLGAGLSAAQQWMWDGFNLHLGLGIESRNTPDKVSYVRVNNEESLKFEQTSSNLGLTGEFTMGFAF